MESEQFLSEISDWFGETETLKATHHIEVKGNFAFVVTPVLKIRVRIWLDPRPLNDAMERKQLHLPTNKEIFFQMLGVYLKKKIDANSGYWKSKRDKQSSGFLRIWSHLQKKSLMENFIFLQW